MTRRGLVLNMAFWTPVSAVAAGLITRNPNWPLNIPLGIALGGLVGLLLWPVIAWIQAKCMDGAK